MNVAATKIYTCPSCGLEFTNHKKLGGHRKGCKPKAGLTTMVAEGGTVGYLPFSALLAVSDADSQEFYVRLAAQLKEKVNAAPPANPITQYSPPAEMKDFADFVQRLTNIMAEKDIVVISSDKTRTVFLIKKADFSPYPLPK